MPLTQVTRRGDAVHCRFTGFVTCDDSQRFVDESLRLLVGARFIVIDFIAMTGYEPAIRHIALDGMARWRAHGVELVLGISESSVTRMLGTTIGLAAHLPLRFCSSNAEADVKMAATKRPQPKVQAAP